MIPVRLLSSYLVLFSSIFNVDVMEAYKCLHKWGIMLGLRMYLLRLGTQSRMDDALARFRASSQLYVK